MNVDEIAHYVEAMRERVAVLDQITLELPLQTQKLLPPALDDLDTAWRKMYRAHAELHQQNQELARTSQAVEEELKRYRNLFEFAPDAYLVTDADGTILEANRAAAMLLKARQQFLVGQPLVSFVPKEERQVFRSQLACLCKSGPVQEWELRLLPCDDVSFNAAVTAIAHQNREDEPVTLLWLLRDITERQLTEVLKTKVRVLESMGEGVNVTDSKGTIFFTNPACDTMFGYEKGELIGKHVSVLCGQPEKEKAVLLGEMMSQLQAKGIWEGELPNCKKDGTQFITYGRFSTLEISGKQYLVCVLEDITQRKQVERALQESEARFRHIYENSPVMMHSIDEHGHICNVNRRWLEETGYTRQEVIGKSASFLMTPESAERSVSTVLPQLWRDGYVRDVPYQYVRKDGTVIDVLLNCEATTDPSGKRISLSVVRNITEKKRTEEALRLAEQKYRSIFENAGEGIFQTTVDGRYLTANPMLASIFGYDSPEELIATVTDISHQLYVDPHRRVEFMDMVKAHGSVDKFESQVYCKNGHTIWISENAHAIYDDTGRLVGYEGTVEDITQRKQAEATIRYQATHDLLTGLPNRTLFYQQLSPALASARCQQHMLAVMFLDLDRFKTINDTLGHAVGDRLLQRFAQRLTHCLREGDTVARWGGDEFTVLLPHISSAEDAAQIAQRILDALKRPFHLEGHEFYISSSIGIVLYPQDGEDEQTLLRNADAALYRTKEQGRNNYQFYVPAMNSQANELLTLEKGLHQALERGEFVVYYQPQLNINTGEITGMEALVRWHHPELGLVLPGQFIKLAEENGLIVPIGEWVLRTACAQNKAWQSAGLPPRRVAVNLSARQFQQANLVEMVQRVLSETGLLPEFLELEITETTIMQNVDKAEAMLRDLQAMGVQITMDDFGTGYSSLSYLKQFPFHTLKIDGSFVRDLTADPQNTAIIKAVLALGRDLNLRIVAEGVETTEQVELLRSLQCEEMQGYLFSRALPVLDATQVHKKLALTH